MSRVRTSSLWVVVSALFAIACWETTTSPTAPSKRCPGSLYRQSTLVPQNVPGGTCCVSLDANAAVGYLCAFGANRQPAGCARSSEEARRSCPNAVTIVRCVRE